MNIAKRHKNVTYFILFNTHELSVSVWAPILFIKIYLLVYLYTIAVANKILISYTFSLMIFN